MSSSSNESETKTVYFKILILRTEIANVVAYAKADKKHINTKNPQGFYIKAFMKGIEDYEKIKNKGIEIKLVATHGVVTRVRNSSTRETTPYLRKSQMTKI